MIRVVYPEPQFRIKETSGKQAIFCAVRKRWMVLTEEEWIRQNFIQYLVSVLHYPLTLMAVEKELLLNGLRKRFDILVYNNNHKPLMLVECKEPAVALNEDVLQQVLRYNMAVPVSYLVLTNGGVTIAWKKQEDGLVLLSTLPHWNELV